jgi:putative membrane protein
VAFFWVGCYFILPIALAGQAWRTLFAKDKDRGFWRVFYASWIGLACNWLLPVAQIGGELAKARLLAKPDEDIEPWATMVIDKTFQVLTQLCFALFGLLLLMFHRMDKAILAGGSLAILVLVIMATFLIRIQKRGLFALSSRLLQKVMKQEKSESLSRVSESMDARVREIYGSPLSLVRAFCWRMAFRFGMAGEIYLIMVLMGHPITYHEAVILESLAQTIRMAAFLIPGGLGAQEGTITLIGASLGIPTSQGLALSLARRGRELLVGLPALLAWGTRSFRKKQ